MRRSSAKFTIAFAKENVFPKYLDVVKSLGVITTGFLGTVTDSGALDLYDGKLRMMAPDGSYEDFPYERYTDFIAEHVEPWSYLKFPYAKKWGAFSMDVDKPGGIYRTNTLARINVCDHIATPLAQAELLEFGPGRRPSCAVYHWARLIELLYNAENAVRLLADAEITSTDTRVKVTPRAARGVGCVESPRGTLIHDYTTDADGILTNVNLIVGTTHNNAPINMSTQAARLILGQVRPSVLNTVGCPSAYDPASRAPRTSSTASWPLNRHPRPGREAPRYARQLTLTRSPSSAGSRRSSSAAATRCSATRFGAARLHRRHPCPRPSVSSTWARGSASCSSPCA
jgi:F420-non-reducing hydrogenase large subunit